MASSEPGLEKQAHDKAENSSSQVQTTEHNPAPLFRARKRSQKARKKRAEEKQELDVDEDERVSKADLLLMKEAQTMREKSRVAALGTNLVGRKSKSHKAEGEFASDNATTVGLRNNFAVERSNNAMEEHMNKYIDEGIRKKFGDQQGNSSMNNSNESAEDNLYSIPEYLKVGERLQYDPGEGMPAAGVEEVELPEQVRLKNEMETLRARDKLHNAPSMGGRPESTSSTYPGGVQPSSIGNSCKPNNEPEDERQRRMPQSTRPDLAEGKKRRFRHATDNLVADRFRKRWRR